MEYKLIYLARRNPAIAQEDFPEAWRDHSRLASKFSTSLGSNFRSVRQCIKVWDADAPASFTNEHDGSALLAMKSFEAMQEARFHPRSLDEMKKDEERAFAGYVHDWTMPCEEYTIIDDGDGEVVLLSFLVRRPDVDDGGLTDRLKESCGAVAEHPAVRDHVRHFSLNRVIELKDPPYDFAAILELWFDTRANAEEALRDPGFVTMLEQPELADPARGVRLFARINYDKAAVVNAQGETAWDIKAE